MCNLRAFRHSCGHHTTRQLSSCRGTYTSPDSQTPLCHAAPSLVVTLPEACQQCKYVVFRKSWESRISEAQEKQHAAGQLFSDVTDYYGGCATEVAEGVDGSSSMMGEDGLGFGDAELAMRERRNAESEVDRLTTQFERELRKLWRPFLVGTDKTKSTKGRSRRPSPRHCGSSPLKIVTAQDDIPSADVPTFDDDEDEFPRRFSNDSDTSSEASSGTSSPSSPSSVAPLWGDHVLNCNWSKLDGASSDLESDGMLPNWGFS